MLINVIFLVCCISTLHPFHYLLNGTHIASCSPYKYLGIHITDNLSWAVHIQHEANRRLGFLKRNFKLAPPRLTLLAFKSLVRSKLEYTCSLWDHHQSYLINNIEAVQNHAVCLIYSGCSYETTTSSLKTPAFPTDEIFLV